MNKIKFFISLFLLLLIPHVIFCTGDKEPEIEEPEPPEIESIPRIEGEISFFKDGIYYPARNWQVTLYSDKYGRSTPVFTGSTGEFYMDVPPGSYILEVWFTESIYGNPELDDIMKAGKRLEDFFKDIEKESRDQDTVYFYLDQFIKIERPITIEMGRTTEIDLVSIPNEYLESFKLK